MKRFATLASVAAVAGAMYVAAAFGGGAAAGPTAKQFAALKKSVAALQAQVKSQAGTITTLSTTVANDAGFIANCLVAGQAAPISEFGDPSGTFGYNYTDASKTPSLVTALDLDGSATPAAYFQLVASSCISSSTSGHSSARHGALSERRVTSLQAAKH